MLATNDRQLAKESRTQRQQLQQQQRMLYETRFGVYLAATRTIIFGALFLLTLSIHFDSIAARTADVLKVELPHGGVLVGRHRVSHKGRHMRAFMGVPYALPPVGELRFKPPVPYGPWVGERQTIQDSPKCIQRDPYRRDLEIEGSEDCLYLNVYTPEDLPTHDPLPVMVYFHGGGFQCGSGISSFYGPEFLLDHDVILVIGNYRVGPLGFLSTETLDCPGNFGLKDQVEILRWVQKNIGAFGGDPKSVTIFGNSAGGASVTYHMLSNSSKGLFQKAIAQSGTYYNPWAQPQYKGLSASRACKVAQLVGCNAEAQWPELLHCLRGKSAKDVVATLYELFEWDYDPMVPFQPVVEPPHEGAFLTVWPRDVGLPHGFALPLMIGATSEEGLLKTAPLLNLPGLLDEYKQQFDTILPIELQYDHHPPEVREEITRKIEEFYFKEGHTYDKYNHQNLTDLISDGWFIAGIDEYIRQRAEAEKSLKMPPYYVYLFEHRSPASFSELFKGGREDYYGACHAEELQYLFPVAMELFVSASPTKSDIELREAILQMWVNFARESNPTPANSPLPHWSAAKGYPINYARLGHKTPEEFTILQMERNLYGDRVNFWHQLSPHIPAEERKINRKDEL
ncbi:PREDICTED: venom carboxylesterase-6-like [Rhagoletis zephyria]|uniref:venom carboxylesterase-6-like n=1 Tax=Rhagoletis zephyria TaxID=28612 RepID=UPI0008117F2E|nr:PREDICTED: venom carboxylesterase-6-like [Rhagoletis zephyria]